MIAILREHILSFCGIYLLVLYGFSLATDLHSTLTLLELPLSASLLSLFQAPYAVYLNTPIYIFVLFIVNSILATIYLYLLGVLIMHARAIRLSFGLSGSLVSIISIGCAACGSLLTPIGAIGSIGIFANIIGAFDWILGVTATILLFLGIVSLYRSFDFL